MKPLEYIAITILSLTVIMVIGSSLYIAIDLMDREPIIILIFFWMIISIISALYLDKRNKAKDKDANDI